MIPNFKDLLVNNDFGLVVTNELTLFLIHHFSRFGIKEIKLFVSNYHKLNNINGFSYAEP